MLYVSCEDKPPPSHAAPGGEEEKEANYIDVLSQGDDPLMPLEVLGRGWRLPLGWLTFRQLAQVLHVSFSHRGLQSSWEEKKQP